MAIHKDLLEILCCPETKDKVALVSESQLAHINAAVARGVVKMRNGETVVQPLDGGLLRADGKYLYAIRDDIPVMLIDEAIDMATVG